MGWFARRRAAGSAASLDPAPQRTAREVPPRFEAVVEALDAGAHIIEACWVAGHRLAEEGTSLGESLEGLCCATRQVRHRDPSFDESHALAMAWSEATLGYLHRLSCSDPLTGLATHAHLRERISELYRDAAARGHALVVTQAALTDGADSISHARTLTLLGATARTVFNGTEAIGQVGYNRLVVLAPRDEQLPGRVSLLKRMAEPTAVRVWIEGLPDTDDHAATLLDELARGA